jgi:hypothetical protein
VPGFEISWAGKTVRWGALSGQNTLLVFAFLAAAF